MSALHGTCSSSDSPRWRRPAQALRSRRDCLTAKVHSLVSVTWDTSPISQARSMFRSTRTSHLATKSHRKMWPTMSRAARKAIDQSHTDIMLTARAEYFLINHHDALRESVKHLQAFAEAGADVLF